ncbi:MAG: response regulator transcription factor [Pseudomonadota bacterium]
MNEMRPPAETPTNGDDRAGAVDARASNRPVLLLYERRTLLREALVSLFRSVAREFRLETVTHPSEVGRLPKPIVEDVALVVISVGSHRVGDEWVAQDLRAMRRTTGERPIIVLGEPADRQDIAAALMFDIQGFIPTTTNAMVALHALKLVRAGATFVPLDVLMDDNGSTGAHDSTGDGIDAPPPLLRAGPLPQGVDFTPRQSEVLELLRHGAPNKIIAYKLGMKISTVKIHVRNIMRKLNVTSRVQAALYASNVMPNGGSDNGAAPTQKPAD